MYKLNKEVRRKIENSMKASFMLVILILLFGCSKQETNSINKIPLNDSYRQYLNYYLGWGSYANKVYESDKRAIILPKNVS